MNDVEIISDAPPEILTGADRVLTIDHSSQAEESPIDKQTQDNYRKWKKNTPFLYDYISTYSLIWPSLTVQFFPDLEKPLTERFDPYYEFNKNEEAKSESEIVFQRLLHGTFTLGQSVDSISILQLPYYTNLNKNLNIDKLNYNHEKEEFELTTVSKRKLNVLQKINHLGDINKLRYMPQNPDVIASSNNLGDLVIYDRTKHASFKNSVTGDNTNINKPQLRLANKTITSSTDIFAIDWNKQKEGVIISADMAGHMNLFDIKSKLISKDIYTINESQYFNNNNVGVNDIEWITNHDSVFGIVDDGGFIKLYDIRASEPLILTHKQNDSVNSISINPGNNSCLATGDSKGEINIWDIRNFGSVNAKSVYSIKGHKDSITQLKWHQKYHNIIGSSSSDKSVRIFDISNYENDDGLLFVHGGHMLGVNDFDWSIHDDWLTASVADDNSLHIWKPSNKVIKEYSSR